jgi:hypothetical protein
MFRPTKHTVDVTVPSSGFPILAYVGSMLNTGKTLHWLSSVPAFPAPTPETLHELIVLFPKWVITHRIPITRKRQRDESVFVPI